MAAQNELLDYMARHCGVDDRLVLWSKVDLNPAAQVLATALVILADWIASSEDHFPYQQEGDSTQRARRAWRELGLTSVWHPLVPSLDPDALIRERFALPEGAVPRPVQTAAVDAAATLHRPGVLVVEAQPGVGKTEAALAAAEVLAARFSKGGVFFALPSMATTDAMFERLLSWVRRLPHPDDSPPWSATLAHGRARLNETFDGLLRAGRLSWIDGEVGSDEVVIAHSWLSGRKKGNLATFVAGTIDQVLFAALQQRHVVLRHLALANKVVVVDEVHAADDYMRSFLVRVLEWLAAYEVPVVLLSATLPAAQRRELVAAYDAGYARAHDRPVRPDCDPHYAALDGDIGYPAVAISDGDRLDIVTPASVGQPMEIRLEKMPDDDESLVAAVRQSVSEGGCIGIVRNTVRRAQHTWQVLRQSLEDEPLLVHSRFVALDRQRREQELRELLGPPELVREAGRRRPARLVVVGTQVIEQSLDVDFDLIISDLAPMDLLMQRLGRLHRHARDSRPKPLIEPRFLITGVDWSTEPPSFDRGSVQVYGEHKLLRSASVLTSLWDRSATMVRPTDIAPMVQDAYDSGHVALPGWEVAMRRAEDRERENKLRRERNAQAFRLGSVPERGESLIGWLEQKIGDIDDETPRGQAAVRDGEDSIEVIVVQRVGNEIRVLPWLTPGRVVMVDTDLSPSAEAVRLVTASRLRLPAYRSHGDAGDRLIAALEERQYPGWQGDRWLAGELVVELDEELSTEVAGIRLHYDDKQGLVDSPMEGRAR